MGVSLDYGTEKIYFNESAKIQQWIIIVNYYLIRTFAV